MELVAATEGGLWVVEPKAERRRRALDEPVRCVATGGTGSSSPGPPTFAAERRPGRSSGTSNFRAQRLLVGCLARRWRPYAGTKPSHVFRRPLPASRSGARGAAAEPLARELSLRRAHGPTTCAGSASPHEPSACSAGSSSAASCCPRRGRASPITARRRRRRPPARLAPTAATARTRSAAGRRGASTAARAGSRTPAGSRSLLLDARGQPVGPGLWWIAAAPVRCRRTVAATPAPTSTGGRRLGAARGAARRCLRPRRYEDALFLATRGGLCGSARTAARAGSSSSRARVARRSPRSPEGRRRAARPNEALTPPLPAKAFVQGRLQDLTCRCRCGHDRRCLICRRRC